MPTAEQLRLDESTRLDDAPPAADWRKWGPYVSARAWGTVREDYSPDGSAWGFFPHDHARSRAYRWNEDGLLGVCDRGQYLCLALALWNGADPILKERPFGLTGPEGNHGEDVKEYYFFLDSTPTHSYMKALYKYPQGPFPYADLAHENARRGKLEWEYELLDTGAFADNRYFDVVVEYAKAGPDDLLMRVTAHNRGPAAAPLHVLPTAWFRNTWSWGGWEATGDRPAITRETPGGATVRVTHPRLNPAAYRITALPATAAGPGSTAAGPDWLFCENDTNAVRLWGAAANATAFVKDGINQRVVHGDAVAVNPDGVGTKAAAHYVLNIAPGASATVHLRLSAAPAAAAAAAAAAADFDAVFADRIREADEFYAALAAAAASADAKAVQRQALAGMLWSKQFYHYNVRKWLAGDPGLPTPPAARLAGRNADWDHLDNRAVLSMPDSWEYPWYAAWDLAFHTVPLALVDPDFAKRQLVLLLREWYMKPNGQLPAYEWAYGDVNPPVHAWAALRVYEVDRRRAGKTPADFGDTVFLERVFHKLLLNFTWWVNRKDADGLNLFQGGFLGLDNIGLLDRSNLPPGVRIDQSDGTSWMAMYCLNMLGIALELARKNRATYEDVATKFLEHFFHIAHAMNDRRDTPGGRGAGGAIDLWDDQDNFYYDVLRQPDGAVDYMRVRSMVGLIPLLAVQTIEPELLKALPDFDRRLRWFLRDRKDLTASAAAVDRAGTRGRRLFSVVNGDRLRNTLARMLDESEFLSPHGVRSLSKHHRDHPVNVRVAGQTFALDYQPAESNTGMFGGNSNWRGPVWMPINYLIVEALRKFHAFYGDTFKVDCPTTTPAGVRTVRPMTLAEVADELSARLVGLFTRDADGHRPVYGGADTFQTDPNWKDHVLFYEYFHGDNGAGLGASHQTGWTGLVADLIQSAGR